METRLRAAVQVGAAVRMAATLGIVATVVRKGEEEAGAIIIKLRQSREACSALVQARDAAGKLGWMRATGPEPVSEESCDAYIERQVKRDPDIWVVEIEDRQGRHLFDGAII